MTDISAYLYFSTAFLAIAASLAGIFIVLRRMALAADALSHVSLPGIALGLLYGFNPFWGAFFMLALAVILVVLVEERGRFSPETIVGILFTTSLAVGTILIPDEHLAEALFGDIEKFTPTDSWFLLAGSAIALAAIFLFWKGIVRTMFSKQIAQSERLRVRLFEFAYWGLIVFLVALGIKVVGSLLMGALLILPAVTARNVTYALRTMALVSVACGIFATVTGLLAAQHFSLPPGPAIILSGTALFVFSFLFVRR